MEMNCLLVRLQAISADCEAEQARLVQVQKHGQPIDGDWYANLHVIACMALAAQGVVAAMIESDTFEVGGEDAYK